MVEYSCINVERNIITRVWRDKMRMVPLVINELNNLSIKYVV